MSTTTKTTYTIGEASERTGLPTHTLRFYEREGLFLGPIDRDSGGRRRFTDAQIEWLTIGAKLRSAGMPLPEIRRYAEAGRDARDAAAIQLRLLQNHAQRVRAQLRELESVLAIVEGKIANITRPPA
ncbi:MerR family transcriptional regulator [Homoserinibacter sp. YIM 151385]|uniref:MerR family transcriptional regulator n=1 Tax=Homoserinibacter sp. YIM 151385 TaxID=2985506 RepID=UPI0022F0D51C|nr:MerR family transcriptional regulator [Homoserinibacter sp. YIM 151385]WBU38009.1 MerR family transcriptional regulator [Homoserinibacter sp. YIM 151385]